MWPVCRLLRFKSNRTTLGIEISSTAIKLLELSQVGKQHCVENYARHTLPEHAVYGGVINDIDSVAEGLSQLSEKISLRNKHAVIVLPNSCTIRKTIQVSERLNEDDLEELVLIELEKHIPYSIDDIHFDFNVLGPSVGQRSMRDVLIVASKAEYIEKQIETLRVVGCRTKSVDVESHAIQRVLQWMFSTRTHCKTIAVLDVGACHIRVCVFYDLAIIFVHDYAFDNNPLYRTDSNPALLLQIKTEILLQIKRALQCFDVSHPGHSIDDIVLTGGRIKQADLTVFLQDNLSIPIHVLNPFANMLFAKQVCQDTVMDDAHLLMTVCGLALRA